MVLIVPDLCAAIAANALYDANIQAHAVVTYLGDALAGFGMIEARG